MTAATDTLTGRRGSWKAGRRNCHRLVVRPANFAASTVRAVPWLSGRSASVRRARVRWSSHGSCRVEFEAVPRWSSGGHESDDGRHTSASMPGSSALHCPVQRRCTSSGRRVASAQAVGLKPGSSGCHYGWSGVITVRRTPDQWGIKFFKCPAGLCSPVFRTRVQRNTGALSPNTARNPIAWWSPQSLSNFEASSRRQPARFTVRQRRHFRCTVLEMVFAAPDGTSAVTGVYIRPRSRSVRSVSGRAGNARHSVSLPPPNIAGCRRQAGRKRRDRHR